MNVLRNRTISVAFYGNSAGEKFQDHNRKLATELGHYQLATQRKKRFDWMIVLPCYDYGMKIFSAIAFRIGITLFNFRELN